MKQKIKKEVKEKKSEVTKQDKHKKEHNIFQNSLYNLVFNVINRFGGFIFSVLVARLLLTQDILQGLEKGELFGIYSLALAVVFLFLASLDVGVNTTSIRYAADALGMNKEAKARAYFKYLLKFKLVFAFIISSLIFTFAKPISLGLFHKSLLIIPLQIGALYFFISALLTSFISAFYFLKKVKYNAVQETIFQVSRIVLVFIFIFIFKFKAGGVMLALSIAAFFSLVYLVYLLTKHYSFLIKGKAVKIDKRRLYLFLGFMFITSISGSFFVHIDSVMLGALLKQSEFVGFYQLALTIAVSIGAIITFSNVFFPLFAQKKGKEFSKFFNKVLYYSLVLSLPLTAILALTSKPFIILLYCKSYEPIALPLFMLSFLVIEAASGALFTLAFQAKEKQLYPTILTVISAVINIVLNYFLIITFAKIKPEYGMLGSATAVIVSRYFYFLVLIILSKKHLNISIGKKVYKPIFASLLIALFLFLFNKYFGLKFPLVLLELLIACLIYFIVMILIKGLNKQDLTLLKLFRF